MRRQLAAALALLAAAPAGAGTAVEATVEDLARAADAVVRGTVVRRESRVTPDGLRIYTFVDLRVDAAWKGSPPAAVTVRTPGGEVGRFGQRVDGAAAFADGEEVVVFLSRAGDVWQVAGLAQGKFAVVGSQARPDLAGLRRLPRAAPPGERVAGPMSLEELERRVRGAR
ncbi:MAG TPA: hypothetical protein VH880_03305 [Anaeromyxobacteraceae bacterium]